MDAADAFAEIFDRLKGHPEFDGRILSDLRDDTDALVALKILARFSITLAEGTSAISEGMKASNVEAIWKALHKTSGSAELVGFRKFGVTSRELLARVKSTGAIDQNELGNYLQRSQKILADLQKNFPDLKNYL